MFNLESLVRENIKRLVPYSSARKEFAGEAQIYLDANENNFGSPIATGAAGNYNRYPDPLQREIKAKLAAAYACAKPTEIFVGNGSDEAIDLLLRIFCQPQKDNILICPPTYGMYEVAAEINDAGIKRVNLTEDFQLDLKTVERTIDANTKLIFVCSPNNPTGNSFARAAMLELAKNFGGILVVDEAYIHFSKEKSLVGEINKFPNLVVLQTFSKAWGLAGLRVGLAFANEKIIKLFNKVKPPYNVSEIAQRAVLEALENGEKVEKTIAEIIFARERLIESLRRFSFVRKIYPSDANFVLVKTNDADSLYDFLLAEKIVVRNRDKVALCAGCLRITVGTPEENESLIDALGKFAVRKTENGERLTAKS
ncbi:MAG TPA: histidinol-phosphate transaminase [Pyrinomonadaceae bacterium]|nr:histidinol-phosphate transaminase [Pyrinomonadaceae bacterium]